MFDILIKSNIFRQLIHTAVYPDTHISALLCTVEELCMGSFPPPDDRRQELYFCSLRKRHDLIHHLIYRLLGDLSPALRAVWDSHSGIQKSEIVVDLGHSPHCGSGIMVGRFLIDRD